MALAQQGGFTQNGAAPSSSSTSSSSSAPWPSGSTVAAKEPGVDPFDVAWAAKAVNKPAPFGTSTGSGKQVKQFEVQL